MPAHQRVRTWVAEKYQKPAIDQEWLADCSDWVSSELGLDPNTHFDQFIEHVEAQLLQSNLADSTVSGSGIDPHLFASNPNAARPRSSSIRRPARRSLCRKNTTGPTPLLVEIKNITEIAHSAFSLLNTHQARLDRADLGLAQEDVNQRGDEDEGPVPRFPRGMLRFELSDGSTTFRAIEFRTLPQLELGTTPLGYKMFLESTPIRNGIAFLEPSNVTLKGYKTEDHDINSEQVFLSSLRKRLGRPDPPSEVPAVIQPRVNPLNQPAPAYPAHQHQPLLAAQLRSPPADTNDAYVDHDVDPDVLREMAIQIDEAIDKQQYQHRRGAAPPAKPPATSKECHAASPNANRALDSNTTTASSSLDSLTTTSVVKTSAYFSADSSESKLTPDIGLSPRPVPPPKSESSILSVTKLGPISTKLSSLALAKHVPLEKWPVSPDPYDNLPFDVDVDESFFEQVGVIEQGVLGVGANKRGKGRDKDTGTESTTSHSRRSTAPVRKVPSGLVLGMEPLAPHTTYPFGAEPSSLGGSTKRATSVSSLSGSTESLVPQSTRSSNHRLSRDPSLLVISSEDEGTGGHGTVRPLDLARRRADKGKETDQDEVVDLDVIEISD